VDVFDPYHAPVPAVLDVPREEIGACGVIDAEPISNDGTTGHLFRIRELTEKLALSKARSTFAIIGRYALSPQILKSPHPIDPGAGGEIQFTDALRHLLRSRPI
jgi:UTP--glucose-1-phosphate uridylyltransferase